MRYRYNYCRLFARYARVLRCRAGKLLFRSMVIGSNPRVYTDQTGFYRFNELISRYLKSHSYFRAKRIDEITLGDEDIKIIAINFKILAKLSNANILKYFGWLSYDSRREMNRYLYMLRGK